MPIITRGMIGEAVVLARPSARMMLRTKELIWGPKYVMCSLRVRDMIVIDFRLGTFAKWNPKWGEEIDFAQIARRKRRECERGKANTSVIIATRPWTLKDGDYLYAGGAYRDEMAIGVSGAKSRTDEAIGEMILNNLGMLAQLETDKRIAANQMQI